VTTYLLGVDGGTTKTVALVADAHGRVLGAGRRGGSNWTGSDVTLPMAVVAEAAREALHCAGLAPQDITLGMFALAGADWPEDHERRQAALERANLARKVAVKNDAFAGMRAGSSNPYGVVIAAGTGTNTAAIAPDGREWAFGYFVDAGGAGDLANQAIVAVLRAEDGRGAPTLLTGLALRQLGFPSAEAMLRGLTSGAVNQAARHALAPLVFEASFAGDPVASEIVVRQGVALAEYATALIRRFDMTQLEFEVVLAGSVFKGRRPLLIDTVTQAIHRVAPRARIVRARFEPAVGALLLAFDTAGIAADEELYRALEATAPPPAFYATADSGGYMNPREAQTP
jgi:N-acetylglucosamine kinase-like BadF-type ATPase